MTLSQQVEALEVENGRLRQVEKRLRDERDDAREEVAQLRKLLHIDLPARSGSAIPTLPPVRARLLNLLLEREFVTRDIAEQALTRGGTHRALNVHFSMLRKHMPPGVKIMNKAAQGWWIPAEQKILIARAI